MRPTRAPISCSAPPIRSEEGAVSRARSARGSGASWLAFAVLWAAVVGIVIAIHDDFGVTWDDAAYARYGELALQYFASGGSADQVNEFYDLKYYGPTVEMIAALGSRAGRSGPYEARHLVIAILATLSILAVGAAGRMFDRRHLPLIAALILIMLPRFVGHAFVNSKDVPFAIGVTLSMAALSAVFINRDLSWKSVSLAGLVLGLTLSLRPSGLVVLLVFFLGISFLTRWFPPPPGAGDERGSRKGALLGVAWLTLYLTWPWAHLRPIRSLLEAAALALAFPRPIPVLFDGGFIASNELPWYYLPKYVLITTPPSILLLFLIGVAVALRQAWRRSEGRSGPMGAITLMWFFLPLLVFVVRRPTVYDGLRHFLFILPALALLAALGATKIPDLARTRAGRAAAWLVVTVLIFAPARALVRLHPYEMTYFNAFTGGMSRAAERFETDYWLTGYREAIEWVNAAAEAEPGRTHGVLLGGWPIPETSDLADGPECWADRRLPESAVPVVPLMKDAAAHRAAENVKVYVFTELWKYEIPVTEMDFYVSTTRFRYDECFPGAPIAYRVEREGATYAVVKRLAADRSARAPDPGPADSARKRARSDRDRATRPGVARSPPRANRSRRGSRARFGA